MNAACYGKSAKIKTANDPFINANKCAAIIIMCKHVQCKRKAQNLKILIVSGKLFLGLSHDHYLIACLIECIKGHLSSVVKNFNL
jgi:hypothetical protein